MDDSIYRFISFESFVDMVQRQALPFVSLHTWDDPYEGFVFKALKSEEGLKKIQLILSEYIPTREANFYPLLLSKFENTIHCQSWSLCPESDALWRVYSHNNKSIRIQTSSKKVKMLENINKRNIEYADSDLETELKLIFKIKGHDNFSSGTMDLTRAFTFKRRAFEHEQEVRLLTTIDSNYMPNDSKTFPIRALDKLLEAGEITKDQYCDAKEGIERIEKVDPIKYVNYGHIDSFVSSVMLHPLANDWFDETVSEYCSRNGIKYEGKSNLYRLNI